MRRSRCLQKIGKVTTRLDGQWELIETRLPVCGLLEIHWFGATELLDADTSVDLNSDC